MVCWRRGNQGSLNNSVRFPKKRLVLQTQMLVQCSVRKKKRDREDAGGKKRQRANQKQN